jgi:hypothetical protein
MCFSATADLAVGAALVPIAVASLREVRHRRELPFALLPTVFAIHQFVEALVWAGQEGNVPSGIAEVPMRAYLFIAYPLLPTLIPVQCCFSGRAVPAEGSRGSSRWVSSCRATSPSWCCSSPSRS